MLNEVLKACEKRYLLMQKLIKKTRNKRPDGCILGSYKFLYEVSQVSSKPERQCKKGIDFAFDFGC